MSPGGVAGWPSRTCPKLTDEGEALRVPCPVAPVPPRLTAATVPPWLPVTFSKPESPVAAVGLKVTVTATDAPGAIDVPLAGRPRALHGPAGAGPLAAGSAA